VCVGKQAGSKLVGRGGGLVQPCLPIRLRARRHSYAATNTLGKKAPALQLPVTSRRPRVYTKQKAARRGAAGTAPGWRCSIIIHW
jgi:hypothetical protein